MNWVIKLKLYLGFGLVAAMMLCSAGFEHWARQRAQATQESIARTDSVLFDLEHLISYVRQITVDQRAYIISGDENAIAGTSGLRKDADRVAARVQAEVAGDPRQAGHFAAYLNCVRLRRAFVDHLNDTRKTQGFASARALFDTGEDDRLLGQMQTEFDAIKDREQFRLSAEEKADAQFQRWIASAEMVSLTLALLLLAGLAMALVRSVLRNVQTSVDSVDARAQTALNDEHRILRALIDNIPNFLYVKDVESRFVLANSYLAATVGAESPEMVKGKTDFDFFPEEMASVFYRDDQRVIQTGEAMHNKEEFGLNSAGYASHILTTKVPLQDSNGQMIGLAGIGLDITARKTMEDELWEAERKYRGIFDKAIVGIFQSTPDGRILSVNPAMASTFGYDSPEDMMACTTDISREHYVNPARREEFKALMESVGSVQNFEFEAFCKDRSKIWLAMSAVAIRCDGVVVRYEGMSEDITERNRLREQLAQAQKLESVGQLAAGIAHEINTPTQYIGDNVRFLQDAFSDLKSLLASYECLLSDFRKGALPDRAIVQVEQAVERADPGYLLEEIPKAIEQALEGVNRVSTLVSAMKEFSHPDTKEKTPLNLNHAIDSTIIVARNEWKYVADMETEFDASLPLISCLPGEFNQVILNLIVNAAHAIAEVVKKGSSGKGKIRVQTRSCPDWVEIRVQDTGSGIPEHVRSRIFDPFFTTKDIGKGTGQGLAIARSVIVDKHGGSIQFETEQGRGSTFIVRLPYDGKSLAQKAAAA